MARRAKEFLSESTVAPFDRFCCDSGLFVSRTSPPNGRVNCIYDLVPGAGTGWMDLHPLANGMLVGRSSFRLAAPLEHEYLSTPDTLGFGLLLSGHMQVQQPRNAWSGTTAEGVLMVRNGDLGRLRYASPATCALCGVSIDLPRSLAEVLRDEGLGQLGAVVHGACALLSMTTDDAATLQCIGRRMLTIDPQGSALGQIELESLALDLLLKTLSMNAPARPLHHRCRGARWRAALDDALSILQAEWGEPHTIASLARRVGVNECYLKSLFRERTGDTIGGYLRRLRMQHARSLIESGEHTVQQVALQAGYANPSHFAAAFRKLHGMSPSALRR